MYGLALHQAYEYYVHYPYDKLWLKIYVSTVAAAIPRFFLFRWPSDPTLLIVLAAGRWGLCCVSF